VPLVYEAHNVETHLKAATLGPDLARVACEVEAEACAAARLVIACSADDAVELGRLYGVESGRLHVAPNGVDTTAIVPTDAAARAARRRALGIDETPIALFVGSRHQPNVEAAEAIVELAGKLPEVTFLLLGGHCEPLAARPRPRNVALMGRVDEATLAAVTTVANVALNPMRTGSGTNLKIATYFAVGLPVVTTPLGARGYGLVDDRHAVVCSLEDFASCLRALLDDETRAQRLGAEGRRLAETRYDWGAVAAGVVAALERVLADAGRPECRRFAGG
jgi:glycosyltransferase involved in cell wall biosynthesis